MLCSERKSEAGTLLERQKLVMCFRAGLVLFSVGLGGFVSLHDCSHLRAKLPGGAAIIESCFAIKHQHHKQSSVQYFSC